VSRPAPSPAPAWLRAALGHSRAVLIGAVAVFLTGLWAAFRVPVEWVPQVELPRVNITATWPGASPRAVERSVTAPIERALRGIPGTIKIESQSRESLAVLRLEVAAERDLGLYSAEVSDRLAALARTLPPYVVPRLSQEVPEALREEQGFMTLQLVGGLRPEALRRLAEEVVAPRLRSLSGIAGAAVEGGEASELLVAFDPARLQAHDLKLADAQLQLRELLTDRSYGWLSTAGGQTLLLAPAARDGGAVGDLPLVGAARDRPPVRLADVARITLGAAPVRGISRIDGQSVVTLQLDRAPGSHLLEVSRSVAEAMAALPPELPAGVRLLIADDRSRDVRRELRDLAHRGGTGLLAIGIVLLAMLGSSRAAALVAASTALALAVAIGLLAPLGLSLNFLTLAGLAMLVGLLVDNATVVVEQLLVELSRPGAREAGYVRAAGHALAAVWLPLLGCTGTTVIVFLPMAYLTGELKGLFSSFAVLAALTLVFSLFSAAAFVPILGQLLPYRAAPGARSFGRRARKLALVPYALASRHPVWTVAVLLLAIGLPTPLLPDVKEPPEEGWASPRDEEEAARYNRTLGSDPVRQVRRYLDPLIGGVTRPFLAGVELGRSARFEERPEIQVRIQLPTGSGVERADELIHGFEQRALTYRTVERTLTRALDDTALLRVVFPQAALKTGEPLAVREALTAQALGVAGAEISVGGIVSTGFFSGLGQATGFQVEAFGPSYDGLLAVSRSFAERLADDPRVAQVDVDASRTGRATGREVLRFQWGSDATARTGIPATALAAVLRTHLQSPTPSFFAALAGNPHLPVRLITTGADERNLEQLLAEPLPQGRLTALRLADLARLEVEREPPAIERENQQYKRYIQVYYQGPTRMGRERIDREIAALPLPPGYRLERPKYTFFTETTERQFFGLIGASLGLVFLLMAAVLESWSLAGRAMASLPLAWIGIALAFVWSAESFAEGAFLGIVLTIGVAVNAGVLLLYRFRSLAARRPGTSPRRLALLAVRSRLRPLWATTLTSIVGMLPALVIPDAEPFWRGLAVTVIGGLLSSTLLAPAAAVALLSWRQGGRGNVKKGPQEKGSPTIAGI
jgi:HAE1 family hydrophobic/amphiphilic exporter-1